MSRARPLAAFVVLFALGLGVGACGGSKVDIAVPRSTPELSVPAGGGPASAETAPAETEGEGPAVPETRGDAATGAHLLLFSGADVWRNGAFMHGGFLYAFQGLNRDGPVFKFLLNGGLYRFHSAGIEITGR